MSTLTGMINKLIEKIVPLPVGSELLQEAIDAFRLLANANTELNQRLRESTKPDLHYDYKQSCFLSIPFSHKLDVWE